MSRRDLPQPARYVAGVVTRVMFRHTLPWLSAAVGVTAALYGALAVGLAIGGVAETSVWASASWLLHWVGFAGGIAVGLSIPQLVSHGVTRRRSSAVASGVVLTLAAGLAAVMQAGLVLEQLVFRAAGRPHRIDGAHLFSSPAQAHLVLAEYGLMFAGFLVTGWLVIIGYLRLGGWRGTLALPLAALPAVGTLGALSTGWTGRVADDTPWWVGTAGEPMAIALAAAVVTAGLFATHALTRTIPIK